MKRSSWIALGLVLFLAFFVAVGIARGFVASTASEWHVYGNGGAGASGGDITMHSTFGQTAIGAASGGDIDIGSGYWAGAPRYYAIFLPLVVK